MIASVDGEPRTRRVVNLLVKKVQKELKIEKDLSPHSFRHTFASLLLADKVPVPEVSRLLGHKHSGITMETYAHFINEETDSVHNLAASILGDVSTTSNNASSAELGT